MVVNLSPVAGAAAQFFDNSGQVLTGGKVYTYLAGTTTPAATYTNSLGVTAQPNPIILNAAGRVPDSGEIWLADTVSYKFVLKDANDVLIGTYDNLIGINSNLINFTGQEETQTATQGQTVFTLTTLSYLPATNNLLVFVNGSKQILGTNFTETTSTVVTFVNGLNVGDVVDFCTATPINTTVITATQVNYNEGGTGAVTRTVTSKLQESISVKDFGAVGDGYTDDTVAIKAAIAAAQTYAGGNSILFPAGNYLISSTLSISSSSVQLVGEGRAISRITANFATTNIIQFNGVNYSGVKQLSINSSVARTANAAIYIASSHNIIIENIGLENNMWNGIQIEGGTDQFLTTVNDFEIDSGNIGILVGSNAIASDTWIQNGVINACTNAGISFIEASGIYLYGIDIINCNVGLITSPTSGKTVSALFADAVLCDSCWSNGFNFLTSGGNVSEVVMSNCWGSTNGTRSPNNGNGMYFGQGSGKISAISVTNSIFYNNQGGGIFVQGATKVNITNCIVTTNSTRSANNASGITFYQGSSNFSVVGGMCGYDNVAPLNYQQYGIYIDYSCTNYSIVGVDVTGNLSGGIQNFSPTAGHVYGNTGYATNTSGQASISIGASTVVVTHNLSATPATSDISVTPNNRLDVGGSTQALFWVSSATSTTFNISVNATVSGTAIPFSWQARIQGA